MLRDQLNLDALLITRGDQGMTLLSQNEPIHLPTQAREVYDVTGAGDTVVATLATSIAAGNSLEQSVLLSNVAAGVVVGKLGTATISNLELKRISSGSANQISRGFVSEDELLNNVELLKSEQKRIVMVDGCFDVLLDSHIDILEHSKSHGDFLVVALQDDPCFRHLNRGKDPINALATRQRLLESLEVVDNVVVLHDHNPCSLYNKIAPHVLVAVNQQKQNQLKDARAVLENGGTIEFIDGFQGDQF
jgi:D-beta-D-heptose 7-phosphate kinase/D-beta-D-heptose 1-phosphate adenosyltransferase